MKMIFEPFKGERVVSVNHAIERISDHINDKTSLITKEIYFSTSEHSDMLFSLKYKLEGFGEKQDDIKDILVIDQITFKDAKKSWVDFFHQ